MTRVWQRVGGPRCPKQPPCHLPNALCAARSPPTRRGPKRHDRTARTAKARKALEDKFLAEADGDPVRAESLRKAYYARLALKSAQARRRRAGA